MAIPSTVTDREFQKFQEASSSPNQVGVVVVNPDGSNVGGGTVTSNIRDSSGGNLRNANNLADESSGELLAVASYVLKGSGFVRARTPTSFVTVDLASDTAETAAWTPAAGKRFRLLRLALTANVQTKLTFRDGSGGSVVLVLELAAGSPLVLGLGMLGILSAAANNALTVTRGTAATLVGTLMGTEE